MAIHVTRELTIDDIPPECVDDCSQPGVPEEQLTFWQEELELTVDRESALDCLKRLKFSVRPFDADAGRYADKPLELTASTDEELAKYILHLACLQFAEWRERADASDEDPGEDYKFVLVG